MAKGGGSRNNCNDLTAVDVTDLKQGGKKANVVARQGRQDIK